MQLKRKIAGIIVISLLVNTSYAFATDTNSLQQEMDSGLMSIFWTQKVKLFYAALLANNSH